MKQTLYIECDMGAAGDMLMGALYEICPEKELFLEKMNEAFLPYDITIEPVPAKKCGIAGTHMNVSIHGKEEHEHEHTPVEDAPANHHHEHRDYPTILKEIQSLPLPNAVKKGAASVYTLIGSAEAKVHKSDLSQIHFHEVGSLDALADVVGCCYLIHLIAPDDILCSPVHVGNGFVKCAHGVLPVPAPATAELLKGIPSYKGTISSELLTPTGAALLRYFVKSFTAMPPLSVHAIGYGMGTKDFEIANCVRVFMGEPYVAAKKPVAEQEADDFSDFACDDTVLSISCNIDDMTGEAIGLATEILFAAGALDVFTTPIQMKKNRPGILLTCLCPPEERDRFTVLFFLHTTTRGVRYQVFERAKLESTFETRHSSYGNIRIKKSSGYGIEKEKPEFEDLKSIVQQHNYTISLDDVKKQCNKQ